MRTSGNLILIPFRGEDASALRVEVLPIRRATPFENSAPAIGVHCPIAHEVGATITLLWSWMGESRSVGFKERTYHNRSCHVYIRVEIAS